MQKKYHSPFKRIPVSKEGGEKIQFLQNEFDIFWKRVNKVADKCPEKFHAMKAMQESCQWLSRACALKFEAEPKEPEQDKGMQILNTKKPYQEKLQEYVDSGMEVKQHQRREGKSFQNNPKVVFKRKKL